MLTYPAAVTSAGAIYTWGSGRSGQLGHGDLESLVLLVQNYSLTGTKVQILTVTRGGAGYATCSLFVAPPAAPGTRVSCFTDISSALPVSRRHARLLTYAGVCWRMLAYAGVC